MEWAGALCHSFAPPSCSLANLPTFEVQVLSAMTSQIITLTTDFGPNDFFVGAMKGVILAVNPSATIVDLTHLIQPHDIRAAAFMVAQAYREFPPGTVHAVVVDPGVGSARRPLLVVTPRYAFVGPDNGVFSFIYAEEEVEACIHVTTEHYFRKPVSQTFHGRDLFAPVAAWLSKGLDPDCFGTRINDYVKFDLPHPEIISLTHIRGHVIHIDRFGNLITNLTEKDLPPSTFRAGAKLMVNDHTITRFQSHFAQESSGEPFALFGSTGRLEIAVYLDSAEKAFGASVGTIVDVMLPAVTEK